MENGTKNNRKGNIETEGETMGQNKTKKDHPGINIKRLREERGIKTAKDLADATGISHTTICRYEKGLIGYSHDHLIKISEVLGVPMGAFFSIPSIPILFPPQCGTLMREGNMVYPAKFSDRTTPAPAEINDPRAFYLELTDNLSEDFGFQKGDRLLISPEAEVKSNDHVVVTLGHESMVMQFIDKDDHIELHASPIAGIDPVLFKKPVKALIWKVVAFVRFCA